MILPAYRPRVKPLLKAVAAVTAFALTVTGLLPSGWAQGDHLRSTIENKVEAGLEEALRPATQTTRRDFITQSATALAAAWLGLSAPATAPAVAQQPPVPDSLKDLLARSAPGLASGAAFLRRQKITNARPIMPANIPADRLPKDFKGFDFNGFYVEYAPGSRDKFLTDYGRAWIYTQALVLYDLVAQGDMKGARELADALIRLGKDEEALGFKGGWHFSYNTREDPWLDPRAPTGNNLFPLSALYQYMTASGDFRHLKWINATRARVLDQLQLVETNLPSVRKDDIRYGLVLGMSYTEALDNSNIDAIGYRAYEGNYNKVAGDVATEHQFDAVNTFRLAYLANEAAPRGTEGKESLQPLVERHKILLENLGRLWVTDAKDGDHFITGIHYNKQEKRWERNLSIAVDNNSWAGVILPYDEEMAWKAIQFNEKKFVIRQRIADMKDLPPATLAKIRSRQIDPNERVAGTIFFDPAFIDRFIADIVPPGDPDRVVWGRMLQPEATFGYIHFLAKFAQTTRDPARRARASALAQELLKGMQRLQELYGGEGLPYATLTPKLFTTLHSTTATATMRVVIQDLRSGKPSRFLMVDPPEAMRTGITIPLGQAGLEEFTVDLSAVPQPAAPMSHLLSGGLEEMVLTSAHGASFSGTSASAGASGRSGPTIVLPAAPTIWQQREAIANPVPISLPTVDQVWTGEGKKPFRAKPFGRLEVLLKRAAQATDSTTLLSFARALSLESPVDNTRVLRVQVLQKLAEVYRFSDIDLLTLNPEDSRLKAGNRLRRAAGLPALAFERHWEDRGYLVQKALMGSKAGKAIVLARADAEGLMGMSEEASDRVQALRNEGTDVTLIHLGNVTPGAYLRQTSSTPGQGSLTVVVPTEDLESLRMEFTNDKALAELVTAGVPEPTILNGAISLGTKNQARLYLAEATVQEGLDERRRIDLTRTEQTEKNRRERFGVGGAVAVGLVAGATLMGGVTPDLQAADGPGVGQLPIVTTPDMAPPPVDLTRPPAVMKVTIDKVKTPAGEERLNVSARSTPSDRVVAPPTLVSRSSIGSAAQKTGGILARVNQTIRRFFLGSEQVEKWSAVHSPASSLVPERQEVLFGINDPREFLEQGADTVDATLTAIGRSAKERSSQAALAVDIGGYVDFRDYQDLASPVAVTLVKEWVLPLIQKARAHGIKVYVYSSARGVQADMGSYVRNLTDALAMGFDDEVIVTDWEVWASARGNGAQPNEWDRTDLAGKKQLAWAWFQNHRRVLNDAVPLYQATPHGKSTRVYALVNAEFTQILSEVLREKGQKLPERLQLVLMAYDYPPGREAQAAASQLKAVQARWGAPLGIAFNFVPDSDPSLHEVARSAGRAGQVIQETLTLAGHTGQPVFEHLSTQDLTNILKHGAVPPQPVTADKLARAGETARMVGAVAVGLPSEEAQYERKFIPVADPAQEAYRRYWVEPRMYGFIAGVGGGGSIPGSTWRNVNTWFYKGVWWFLDPDTLVWGPEAGITVATLKTVVGTLSGGELEVKQMDLAVTPLDGNGNPSSPEQIIPDVFGRPDPVVDLKDGRWKGELRVTVRRPDGQLRNGRQLLPILTNIEAEVAVGWPGSGGTPQVESRAMNLSSIQVEGSVAIPLGELKPGPSFFTLKTRDQRGEISGWVGPGVDGVFAGQYTEALVERYQNLLNEVEAVLTDPSATVSEKEKALKLRERLGGDVTALQMAVAYQGDVIAPIQLEEVKDEAATRAHLERLRRHGVTHLSLKIKDYEQLANDFLLQFSDQGVDDARLIWGDQADQFTLLTRLAHETGLRIGLQVDAAMIDQLTNILRSPEARVRVESARSRGVVLHQGLDLLKVMVQSNELYRLELDFFNLRVDNPGREARFRQDVEKLMEMLDTLLIVTGPEGGQPTPWAQYATRMPAEEATPEAARAVLERPFPDLIMRARHRYAQSLFLDGQSVDAILTALDSKFKPLIGPNGKVDPSVAELLVERIKTPSVSTLRALGVPEPLIEGVRRKAGQATEQSLRDALSRHEQWAALVVVGRAWEIEAAQQPILERLQRPLDEAILSLHRIQQTRMLMVGNTRPELSLMTPKNRIVRPGGEATVTVRVKNAGNLPARYLVAGYLMGKDTGGNPSWPASSPLVQRYVSVLLKPGEEQEVDVQVAGNVLAAEGKVSYRVLVRDANTLEHLPGAKIKEKGSNKETYLGLSPQEAEAARVDGDLLVMAKPPAKLVAAEQEEWTNLRLTPLVRKFEQMEESRRARTQEEITDPAYQKGYEERLRKFMEPFADVTVEETPTSRNFSFRPKPIGLQEQVGKARADVRKQLEVITLVPEEPERFIPKLWRQFLGLAMVGGLAAWAVGTVLGVFRSIRQGWEIARHGVRLREEAAQFARAGVIPHPPGSLTQVWNMGRELSYYVTGIGAHWNQRWAHLHPEQGKVSRAMEAHGKFVIVLSDETERTAQVVERSPLQRRHRFLRFAAQTTFWAVLGTVTTGILALAGQIAAVWVAVPLSILLLGIVIARAPPLQDLFSSLVYLPVDLVRAGWANTLFFLAAPIVFIGAAFLLFQIVIPAAAAAWIPVAAVSSVAAIWMLVTVFSAGAAGILGAMNPAGIAWRMLGALGLGAAGASAVAWMYAAAALPGWQSLAAVVLVFLLVRTATRIFVQSDRPLRDYAQWTWNARFLVKWAAIVIGLYYGFTFLHPLLFAKWSLLGGASLPAAAQLASTVGQIAAQGVGVAVMAWMLAYRFQFMQNYPRARWPVILGISAGAVAGMPLLLTAMGLPLVWGSFFLGVGLWSYAIGQWGKAWELWNEKPSGQALGAALFRGVFMGVVIAIGFPAALFWVYHGSAALAVGLVYWIGFAPAAFIFFAWVFDHLRWVGFWIHDQFEAPDIERIQLGLAIQHLIDSAPGTALTVDPATNSLSVLRAEFDRLATAAHLPDPDRQMLKRHFDIRRSPDSRPLASYDPALFETAWQGVVDATRRGWHRGVPRIKHKDGTPAQRVENLSDDQQRVLNWYYWWAEAERDADKEVRRQSGEAAGLAGLPAADQEMAVTNYFNRQLKRHKDEIFNQDDGTALRAFGGSLFTGDLRELSARMRRDDSMAVIMPALILSLEFNKDLNLSSAKKLWEKFGWVGGTLAFGVLLAQVVLVNFAVPLGFIASMANRWGRWSVQGGNVLHTLRASADAGMGGYQSTMGYVILVIGRWLIGLLYTLMEVYLGRWVGRGDLEEYFADQYWVPKAGTIEQHVRTLLDRGDVPSLTAAFYAAITGEENSIFDMGLFQLPPIELRQIPWGSRTDEPGVTDPETFGLRMEYQQLPGVVAWRTDPPNLNGGHELLPVRFEIVDAVDLGNGQLVERLSDGQTYRLRDADGTLTYFRPLTRDERQFLDNWMVSFGGDWSRAYSALQEEAAMLRTQLRMPVSDAENQRLNRRLQLINGILGKVQMLPNGRRLFGSDGIFLNGVRANPAQVRRLSQEPGKFHLVLPPGQTKGANVGAGMADYLGMVEPGLEVTRQNDQWRARVVYEKLEDELYPEWHAARHAVQNPDDRLAGERAEAGQEAARQIIRWNDAHPHQDRREHQTRMDSVSDLPQGEMGHNQVRDATGQRFQFRMNFFRWLLERETQGQGKRRIGRVLAWLGIAAAVSVWVGSHFAFPALGVALFVAMALATQSPSRWWVGKTAIAVLITGVFAWPWGLVLILFMPTVLAYLWGRIHPISFIGFIPYNRLQGMKGHYDSQLVEGAFQQLEQRVAAVPIPMSPRPADEMYNEALAAGQAAIAASPRLTLIAGLYHRVLKYDHVPYGLGWSNSSPLIRRFMPVEPRLAQAIGSLLPNESPNTERTRQFLARALQRMNHWSDNPERVRVSLRAAIRTLEGAPTNERNRRALSALHQALGAVQNRKSSSLVQRRLDEAIRLLALEIPWNRWEAREMLEQAIVRELAGLNAVEAVPAEQVRRNVFEALRWRTAGELMALGNRVIGTQYARSRSNRVIRVGDVNTQYGVEGQQALERMMAAVGYPRIGNRSWTRHSDGALYEGVPAPSMMYSQTTDPSLTAVVGGAQRGGFLIERAAHDAATATLYLFSDYLVTDRGNLGTPDRGRGVLELAHEAGLIGDQRFQALWEQVDFEEHGVRLSLALVEMDPKEKNKIIGKAVTAMTLRLVAQEMGFASIVLASPNDKKTKIPSSAAVVRRIDPLEAALTQRRDGQSVRDFYLENTHLQPDLKTTHEYERDRSRRMAEEMIDPAMTVEQVDHYHALREQREGRDNIVRLSSLNIDWQALGFRGTTLQEALRELRETLQQDGEFRLAASTGPLRGFWSWVTLKQRYSKEAILLSLIYGVTEGQLIRDSFGRVVDLTWTNFDSHWDGSEWPLAIGPYLWPGSTMGRVTLWMRRAKMSMALPITWMEASRLLEMPPWLAVASGFNRIWSDMLALPQLLTEDGRHGSLNRLRPTLNPTMNAWNAHWAPFMMLTLFLRKRDKATSRALQLFVGMATEQAFEHLFDHPMFGAGRSIGSAGRPVYTPLQREIQTVFPKMMGLQTFLRDEVETAGAAGAGTFSYGFSGYTASWLAGVRVGPLPPGHAHAYWKYREYVELDRRMNAAGASEPEMRLFSRTLRLIQQRHQPELDTNVFPEDLLKGQPVDPWTVMAEMGARIERARRDSPYPHPKRRDDIRAAFERIDQELDPVRPVQLGPVQVGQAPALTGLEEVQLGTPREWAGSAAGQVIPVSVAGEGRTSSGRAVVLDPAHVVIRQIVNPNVTGNAWDWKSIRGSSKDQQPGKPLADLLRDPQQWGPVEVPADARLGLAMHSFQTNFWEPQGFLVTRGRLVALRGVAWGREPEVFVLDAGRFGLRRLSLADGIPQAQGIQEAIPGPVLVRAGRNVSGEIQQGSVDWPDANAVRWDPRTTTAAFSALGRTADDRLIFLSLVGEPQTGLRQATVGDMAQAMTKLGATEAVLLGGSMDVQQWVVGDGEKPDVLGRHNNAPHDTERPLNAALLVFTALPSPVTVTNIPETHENTQTRSGLEEPIQTDRMETLGLTVAAQRQLGRRANQEDAFNWVPVLSAAGEPVGQLFLAADGMGGEEAGEEASAAFVTGIPAVLAGSTRLRQDGMDLADLLSRGAEPQLHSLVTQAFEGVATYINQEHELQRSGTTGLMVLISAGTAYVAWVGDTRLYLSRNQSLQLLTVDDTVGWEYLRAQDADADNLEISRRYHGLALRGKNALSQDIGVRNASRLNVHWLAVPLQSGDRLLLSTDGVHEAIADEGAIEVALNPPGLPEAAVESIMDLAQNGSDNRTAIVADFAGLPAEPQPTATAAVSETTTPAAPAVTTVLTSPTTMSQPASAVETALPIWVEEFDERQLIVLPPAAAADQRYPGLDSVVGQVRSVGKISFVILPADQAAIQSLVTELAVDPTPTTVHEFGVPEDPWLGYFDTLAQGAFTILPRNPLEGENFRVVMRQLLSNVTGIELRYITDGELDAVAAALGLGSQV